MMSLFCHLPNYNIFSWLLLVISSSQTYATKQLSALTITYVFQENNSWVVWTISFIFARGLYVCDVDAIITRQKDFELLQCLAWSCLVWSGCHGHWLEISAWLSTSQRLHQGFCTVKNQRISDDVVLMAFAAISTREVSNPASSIKYTNEFNRAEWWIQIWGQ